MYTACGVEIKSTQKGGWKTLILIYFWNKKN